MKIYGAHEIDKGWAHWKAAFDAHADAREAAGVHPVLVAHETDNPNKVHFVLEVPSLEALQAFATAPENAPVLKEAGVKPETMVMIPLPE